MHKDLSLHKYINTDKNIKLYPKDYFICINPKIISLSKINHYDYEECGSFK